MIGVLGSRFRGAKLTGMGAAGTVLPLAVTTALDADAYDTLEFDHGGYALGHGLADGRLVVPAGLGGMHLVSANVEISNNGVLSELRFDVRVYVNGAEVSYVSVTWEGHVVAQPVRDVPWSVPLELAEGDIVWLVSRMSDVTVASAPYHAYGVLFALTRLGRV